MKKTIIAAAMLAASATSANAFVLGGINFDDSQYNYENSGNLITVIHSNTGDQVGVFDADAAWWLNVTGHYIEDASSYLTTRLTRYGSAVETNALPGTDGEDFVMGGIQFDGSRWYLYRSPYSAEAEVLTDREYDSGIAWYQNGAWVLAATGNLMTAEQIQGLILNRGGELVNSEAVFTSEAIMAMMERAGTDIGGWTAVRNARGNTILIKTLDSGATIKFRPISGSLKLTLTDGRYIINSTDSIVDLAALAGEDQFGIPASVAAEVSAAASEYATAADVVNAAR